MSVRKDLKRAKRRTDLDSRVRVEILSENGVVKEVRAAPLAEPLAPAGSIADVPFVNAAQAPDTVVIRRW
jgi:long-chain acyl-CoA synthetase